MYSIINRTDGHHNEAGSDNDKPMTSGITRLIIIQILHVINRLNYLTIDFLYLLNGFQTHHSLMSSIQTYVVLCGIDLQKTLLLCFIKTN